MKRLIKNELLSKDVTEDHIRALFNFWQLPMYNLDFKMIEVPIAELEDERKIELANLGGYAQDGLEPLASDYY